MTITKWLDLRSGGSRLSGLAVFQVDDEHVVDRRFIADKTNPSFGAEWRCSCGYEMAGDPFDDKDGCEHIRAIVADRLSLEGVQ